jgi:hypothetical protein
MYWVLKPGSLCMKAYVRSVSCSQFRQWGKIVNCIDICEFVAGICADSNEPSGSMTVGNFMIM